jgi:hypothetical protein
LQIADAAFSAVITGLSDGQEIEVELEDNFGAEFPPFQLNSKLKASQMNWAETADSENSK